MGRVIVVGDVGGHPTELRVGLATVGAGGQTLPAGTVVVQVGDLVDRGPDSAGVLSFVQQLLDRQPDQWVQLLGNHEGQYLPFGQPFWPERLADEDAERLRAWWAARRLTVATAVRASDGDEFLVTHAGLTVWAWQDLGEPATAAEAARRLNERPDGLLWRGAPYDDGDRGPGPLWAEAGWELYEPWRQYDAEGGFVPFGQIHGHSSVVRFQRRDVERRDGVEAVGLKRREAEQRPPEWRCPDPIRAATEVDWTNRHTRTRLGGRLFIGVDPKHGRTGAPYWRPLVLDGATLLAAPAPNASGAVST